MLLHRKMCVCVERWRGQMEATVWKKWQVKEWWEVVCFEEQWGWEEDFLGWFTDPQVDHAALQQRNQCLYLVFFFFPLLCNLFHISNITELHSVCDTWLCSWWLSAHYTGIIQSYKSDSKTRFQLNVLCIPVGEMRMNQLKSSFLLQDKMCSDFCLQNFV